MGYSLITTECEGHTISSLGVDSYTILHHFYVFITGGLLQTSYNIWWRICKYLHHISRYNSPGLVIISEHNSFYINGYILTFYRQLLHSIHLHFMVNWSLYIYITLFWTYFPISTIYWSLWHLLGRSETITLGFIQFSCLLHVYLNVIKI